MKLLGIPDTFFVISEDYFKPFIEFGDDAYPLKDLVLYSMTLMHI